MTDYTGKFVVVEGIDGSGKGTLIDNLQDQLYGNWHFTREPSDRKYGEIIRNEIESGDEPSLSDFYLFLSDRYDHVENEIRPKLENNGFVLCDRYHLSTLAYQHDVVGEVVDMPSVYIEQTVQPWYIEPDLTLYIDVPVDTALERIDSDDKYEKRELLEDTLERYRRFVDNRDSAVGIDGTDDPETVCRQAIRYIKTL